MSAPQKLTFASAVNDRELFASNFLASPIFAGSHQHQIIVQSGFLSAAKAYNDAIDRSENEIIVFAHQDMVFPESWLADLERALNNLDHTDPNWGVLGCFGETADAQGRGHVYMPGLGIVGSPFENPQPVQTLDEIVLIIKKSSGLRFDPNLPHFHFYGADICLRANRLGRTSYAISAFCLHNTQFNLVLPREFYACYRHIKREWRAQLPIQTTCVRVTKYDLDMMKRRIREFYLSRFRGIRVGAVRSKSGRQLLGGVWAKK
jgi:Glycosyltransferase like family